MGFSYLVAQKFPLPLAQMKTIWAIFRIVALLAALLFPQIASAAAPAPKAETRVWEIDVVLQTSLQATSLCVGETRSAESVFAAEVVSRCSIAARGGGQALKGFSNVVTRTTRGGAQGVRLTRPNGSVMDITASRVKEFVPNLNPNAPAGALSKVKFSNALPGTKGLKRPPTADELRLLSEAFK